MHVYKRALDMQTYTHPSSVLRGYAHKGTSKPMGSKMTRSQVLDTDEQVSVTTAMASLSPEASMVLGSSFETKGSGALTYLPGSVTGEQQPL